MFKFFKKKLSNTVGRAAKSWLGAIPFSQDRLSARSNLSFAQCIAYYQNCAPLFSAVQLIADEVASIQPYLYDKTDSEFIRNHELLDLLNAPNADITGSEFFEQISSYFLITGNCFIIAHGDVNKPPKELFVVPPYYITLNPGADNFVESIDVSGDFIYSESFVRKEVNGHFRYYAGPDKEIWFIKEFNPRQNNSNLYGMSKLMPIYYELEQYLNASVHNLSLLMKGARPSGAFKAPEMLSDDQFERLKEQIDVNFVGSSNAGRPLLLENNVDFLPMAMTNKDMDFLELKRSVANAIYIALKIPLPLISGDYATYSNMEIAKLSLYDNAVLPLVNRLYSELTNFLLPRYGIDTQYKLYYSTEEVSALEPRANEEINKIKNIGVLTINELRAKMGYEGLEGGDSLYGPMNQIPIAKDVYTDDEPKQPSPKLLAPAVIESKEEFITFMQKQIKDNKRKYSDEYIEQLAIQYGFNDDRA